MAVLMNIANILYVKFKFKIIARSTKQKPQANLLYIVLVLFGVFRQPGHEKN